MATAEGNPLMAWYDEYFLTPEQKAARAADQRLQDTLSTLEAFGYARERFPARRVDNSGLAMQVRQQQARAARQELAATGKVVAEEWEAWQRKSGYLPHEVKKRTDALLDRVRDAYGLEARPDILAASATTLQLAQDAVLTKPLLREVRRLRGQLEAQSARARQERADIKTISDASSDDERANAALRIINRKPGKRAIPTDGVQRISAATEERLFRQQGIED